MSEQNNDAADVYEMLWDCKYCGQKKLLGLTHRFCAGCGGPQNPAARYFPEEHEKVAVKNHPFVGADVACPACKQPMSRAAKCCTHCGSPIAQGVEVARKADVVMPPPGTLAQPFAGGPPTKGKTSNTGAFVVGGIVAAMLALMSFLAIVVLWKRSDSFVVAGHTWERSIAVERFEPVRKSVWCDEAPSGSRELSRRKEQRSTKKEQDGETCGTRKKDLGNGAFKEVKECTPKYKEVPVMGDRCEIEAVEWHTARTLTERGASTNETPRWPAVNLARLGSCIGCEREGKRAESYTLKLTNKAGKETSCEFSEKKWASFAKGSKWNGKTRVITGGVDCESLTP